MPERIKRSGRSRTPPAALFGLRNEKLIEIYAQFPGMYAKDSARPVPDGKLSQQTDATERHILSDRGKQPLSV